MAYNASNTDVSHDAFPSIFSLLPSELVIEVLAHTMVSKVPFDLQKFIELGALWASRASHSCGLALFLGRVPFLLPGSATCLAERALPGLARHKRYFSLVQSMRKAGLLFAKDFYRCATIADGSSEWQLSEYFCA